MCPSISPAQSYTATTNDNGEDSTSDCSESESSGTEEIYEKLDEAQTANVHKNERFFTLNKTFSKRKSDGKVYIDIDSCFADKEINKAPCLPHDINDNVVYEVPYHTAKRYASTVDGYDWGHRDKSRRAGFTGDRFLAKCKGYFQCLNPQCPHIYRSSTQ